CRGRWREELVRPVEPADRSEARTAGRPAAGSYLALSGISVDAQAEGLVEVGERHECRAVGCKSRFCAHCCKHRGRLLRERLLPVLKTFSCIRMLTLTIDPELFESAEAAYWYCRDKRVVFWLVKRLFEAGWLKSRRFFYVVEWHKNGWPHF